MAATDPSTTPRALLHETRIAVRWRDLDALAHVNNASYLTYFEEARIEWLARHDLHPGGDCVTGPVIADAHCTFHRPIGWPQRLLVRMFGGPPGRSSFQSSYEVAPEERPAEVWASGSARVVWVDYRAGRSVPLPEAVRRLLPPADGPTAQQGRR